MTDEIQKVTGGCLCGEIRYEATKPALDVEYCHCRMCQRNTGSAFHLGVMVPKENFRFTKGAPKFYESSPVFHRVFCPDCGSPLILRPQESTNRSRWVGIHIGTLDNPEEFVPTSHCGTESLLPWLEIDDQLPRYRYEEDHIEKALNDPRFRHCLQRVALRRGRPERSPSAKPGSLR